VAGGLAAGLLDDYANLVAVVADFQDRAGHAGLDRFDYPRAVIRRQTGHLVDSKARRSERYLEIDNRAAVFRHEDPDSPTGEGIASGAAPALAVGARAGIGFAGASPGGRDVATTMRWAP